MKEILNIKMFKKRYQEKYKQRMERQILIANPSATEKEVSEMIVTGGAIFTQQVSTN